MQYEPPVWGVWSADRQLMVVGRIADLDDAKYRAGTVSESDASVEVVQVCPRHDDQPSFGCTKGH